MPELEIALFVEDVAQENFIRGLVGRIAQDEGLPSLEFTTRNGVGGYGKNLTALRTFVRDRAGAGMRRPDLLVVCVDADGVNVTNRHDGIANIFLASGYPGLTAIGVADPYVEAWYLADPQGLAQSLGAGPTSDPGQPERVRYKHALVDMIERSGHITLLGGADFAEEILEATDLERAALASPTLGAFRHELRSSLRTIRDA